MTKVTVIPPTIDPLTQLPINSNQRIRLLHTQEYQQTQDELTYNCMKTS